MSVGKKVASPPRISCGRLMCSREMNVRYGITVGAFEWSRGRHAACHRIGKAALTGNHGEELSYVLVEETPCVFNRGWQIWQMLEDVDSDISVEGTVLEQQMLLAVFDDCLYEPMGLG